MSRAPKPPTGQHRRDIGAADTGGARSLPHFFHLIERDTVTSTNDVAKELAADSASEGTLVCAREQTAGRGRQGRQWISPPGNVYMSLVLRPPVPLAAAPQIGFVAAVALADELAGLVAPDTRITQKWPNDVLVDGRKISGILLETATRPDGRIDWLVLGIGVNVHNFPEETRWPATALEPGPFDDIPRRLVAGIATSFLSRYRAWLDAGFAPVREVWLARSHTRPGGTIVLTRDDERIAGGFETIDETGALVLRLKTGETRTISYGEVTPGA